MKTEEVQKIMDAPKEKKPLILNHVVLCAKNWYKHSKYLWQDYKRAIICDGHYTPDSRHDVAYLLMEFVLDHKDVFLPWGAQENCAGYVYDEIRNRIDRLMYVAQRTGEKVTPIQMYDEAVILFCHGAMGWTATAKFDKVLCPSEKVLPLNNTDRTKEEYEKDLKSIFGDAKPYDEDDKFAKRTFESLDDWMSLDRAIENGELTYENPDQTNGEIVMGSNL